MTTTLITGANKGLGREAARRLLEQGHTVWIGARNEALGREAADALGDGAHFVQLDVTDDASVAAAVQTISAAGGLDVLVNNAGIVGNGGRGTAPRDTTADDLVAVYETNVFGLVRVTHAFIPLLEQSSNPVIVNVSSGLGSITVTNDETNVANSFTALGYPSSKSAVVMISSQYARSLPNFRINAIDPGYTATDLNGHSGTQTVTEGTDAIVEMATIDADGPTNTFVSRDGLVPA